MSHWAEIDSNNKVLRVLVGDNNDPAGDEGYSWLVNNLGGKWIKTSYNAAINGFRKNYAGIGYFYDQINDIFIEPQPFPSWTLDENFDWQPPTPKPNDNEFYYWNENSLSWNQIETLA